MSCIKCGGTMVGDGYTSVIHCENTDAEVYWYSAPDEGPFYCDFTEDPESKLHPLAVGEHRLAFRSKEFWELTLSAYQGGAEVVRFEGTLLEDGYTLVSVIVWVWLNGEVEKFKEEDFAPDVV